jgi:hypothetical protein
MRLRREVILKNILSGYYLGEIIAKDSRPT